MADDFYDVMQRALKDPSALHANVAHALGWKATAIAPGRATMEMDVDARLANPMGTLHGGILCDLADAAMGIAFATELERGDTFTTLELKINFMKPVWRTHLRAEGRIVKRGRTVGLVECDVFDEAGSLVARASSTCLTLRGDMAKGR